MAGLGHVCDVEEQRRENIFISQQKRSAKPTRLGALVAQHKHTSHVQPAARGNGSVMLTMVHYSMLCSKGWKGHTGRGAVVPRHCDSGSCGDSVRFSSLDLWQTDQVGLACTINKPRKANEAKDSR